LTARGLSPEASHSRLAAQLPAAEKAARADFVIDTGGTFAETDAQVDRVFRELQQRFG
jgi:dephospho-CoA kinase